MHTTASDGRLTPAELVARAQAARLTTISVTDHDTVAAIEETTELAAAVGIRVVPGIEITAVDAGRDVHMLGYFFDPSNDDLAEMLVRQRTLRVDRVREIASRLAAHNVFVDVERVLASASTRPGASVGRPQIAREMVRAGHVASVQDAFDVWLASGRPGFVPRTGPSPADVVEKIHSAGGVASMAHPGVTKRDELIAPLIERGLDAIEVYHSDHSSETQVIYRRMASQLKALVSGGSDFHGEDLSKAGRPQRSTLGAVMLPEPDFAALESASRRRQRVGGPAANSEGDR